MKRGFLAAGKTDISSSNLERTLLVVIGFLLNMREGYIRASEPSYLSLRRKIFRFSFVLCSFHSLM